MRYRLLPMILLWIFGFTVFGEDQKATAFFEKQIRPLLIEHCYECHSVEAGKRKGGLLLDSAQGWQTGGDSGPAITPGNPTESLLVHAIQYTDPDLEMPPDGKLPAAAIRLFDEWIKNGAVDPRTDAPVGKPNPDTVIDMEKGRQFWAFQPLTRPDPPSLEDPSWPTNASDKFVRHAQEQAGVLPGPSATDHVLVRRIHFDLIGLPPSPEAIKSYTSSTAPEKKERLVDKLLASPAFGEKWGRHWLDLARYADSTGGGRTFKIPNAWRYRNYVIASFNKDMPYDQFVREQVSGDLLAYKDPTAKADALVATGFLALGPKNLDLQDKELLRMNTVDEQIDTIGQVFLALTLGCARCHDHKFDPIPATDYYALAGILRSTDTLVRKNISELIEQPLPDFPEEQRTAWMEWKKLFDNTTKHRSNSRVPATQKALDAKLARLTKEKPRSPTVAVSVKDSKTLEDCHLCIRGEVRNLGPQVPRGFVTVTQKPTKQQPVISRKESGRRELGDWLTNPDNPLTDRVYVNRLWAVLFGRGIVSSVDNFGLRGERPTHPQLLDWLATQFREKNRHSKAIIRDLILSRTYALHSDDDRQNAKLDPTNRWFWKKERRRLAAEPLRDSLLFAADQLDTTPLYGLGTVESLAQSRNRSVYLPVFREEGRNALMEVFDFPDPSISTGSRQASNIPTQSLYLMNSPFVRNQSVHAAHRLLRQSEAPVDVRLNAAFLITLGRPPSPEEKTLALAFVSNHTKSEEERWTQLMHSLFGSLSFRYLD